MRQAGILAILAIAAGAPVWSQQSEASRWEGVLRDDAGEAVVDAIVRLQSESRRVSATTTSDGRFTFSEVTSGEYTLSIDRHGVIATSSR